MEFGRIFRGVPGGRKAGLGGGFAEARTLVRICSGFCSRNTPAAILRIGAADLMASASAAGPLTLWKASFINSRACQELRIGAAN